MNTTVSDMTEPAAPTAPVDYQAEIERWETWSKRLEDLFLVFKAAKLILERLPKFQDEPSRAKLESACNGFQTALHFISVDLANGIKAMKDHQPPKLELPVEIIPLPDAGGVGRWASLRTIFDAWFQKRGNGLPPTNPMVAAFQGALAFCDYMSGLPN